MADFLPFQLSLIVREWQVIHSNSERRKKMARVPSTDYPIKIKGTDGEHWRKKQHTPKRHSCTASSNHYVMPLVCNCLTPSQRPHCTHSNHTNP